MEKKIFKVRLTALTPVHIGAGLKLRRGVDFVVHNGKLHLLSPEKIWEAIGHGQYESWLKAIEHDRQEEFLRALDPSYQRFASLSIPLKFPPQGHVPSDFHRHITSPTRGAYVPGSSLKGAILTLIVYRNTREGRILIQPFMMGDWKMYNGNKVLIFDDKEIMKKIWGDNPNSSLGRFIRFSDLHAVADSENKTEVHWIRVVNRTRRGWNYKNTSLLAECLPVGWQAEGTLTLLPGWYQQNRNFLTSQLLPEASFLDSKEDLEALIKEQSQEELTEEINDLKDNQLNSFNEGRLFLSELIKIKETLNNGVVVVRLGGHVGWNFTTGGWVKFLDEKQLPDPDFKSLRKTIQRRDYSNMDFWPKTRKATSHGLPLGFVKLEIM